MIFLIGIIFLILFLISQCILTILILIYSQKINTLKNKKKSIGGWYGGVFYARPFIPLPEENVNMDLRDKIFTHNKLVYIFYGNVLTLFISIALLNIGD